MEQIPNRPVRASTTEAKVQIELGERSYPIQIGRGLLRDQTTWEDLPHAACVLVVTNATVGPIYAQGLIETLQGRFKQVSQVILPDGEEHKSWQTLNLIFDALLSNQCDRKTILFALGGGVVGDITGFAAACYMRGVPFVQIPTTLLAQVDSSVGGKTAVNHPMGKNMIGAFYQPLKVVCDLNTLTTLPRRELSAGLAEIIKYGPIADMRFFDWIEANIEALLARDADALAHAVKRSCEIKARVVAQDERDFGLRATLNFGHTFGHAIEAGLGFGEWLHGEAVACGMVMAANLSLRLGLVDKVLVNRLVAVIGKAGLPTRGPSLVGRQAGAPSDNAGRYLASMRHDKKAEGGDIRFVVIDGPGKGKVSAAPDALVREVIDACCQ